MGIPKTIIEVGNGHPAVWCYGAWEEDSNCSCAFDDDSLDGVYADGGANWTAVAKKLAAFARRNGTTLEELVAC